MAADQTTAMAPTPTPSQGQGTISSIMEPEDHTASPEHRLAQQPDGNVPESSESSQDSFVSAREIALDCDKLRGELDVSRRQLETAYRNSATLERQMQDLHLNSSEGAKDLKRKVTVLTAKVRDHESGRDYTQAYQEGVWAGMQSQSYTDELLKQVEAYKALAAK
jgi:hypothetical protein